MHQILLARYFTAELGEGSIPGWLHRVLLCHNFTMKNWRKLDQEIPSTRFLAYGCYVCLVTQSCPTFAIPQTVACQAPLSMGFSRQEYWSGLPFPSAVYGCYSGYTALTDGEFLHDYRRTKGLKNNNNNKKQAMCFLLKEGWLREMVKNNNIFTAWL